MTRNHNFNIPEIDKLEARKEKLRKKFLVEYLHVQAQKNGVYPTFFEIADWWLERLEDYTNETIDQMFEEENNKRRFERECKNCGGVNRTRSSVCEKCCPSKLRY